MSRQTGRIVINALVAASLMFLSTASGFAQLRTNNNQQQQYQQPQRQSQPYQPPRQPQPNQQPWSNQQPSFQQRLKDQEAQAQRQRRSDELREKERVLRTRQDEERRAREARNSGNGTGSSTRVDQRKPSTGNPNYAPPSNGARRATPKPVASPFNASKLTPAQIRAGFKGQFVGDKALVTVGKKTFAINPNGITGRPRTTSAPSGQQAIVGPAIKTRLTALVANGRAQSGGKLPPGGGGADSNKNYIFISNDNKKSWLFREPVGSIARANAIMRFLQAYNVPEKIRGSYLAGHDLDNPVSVTPFKKGDIVLQWGTPDRTGRWFTQRGESWERLGIEKYFDDGTERKPLLYMVKNDILVLDSTAKDFISKKDGRVLSGGGRQYFVLNPEDFELIGEDYAKYK